MWSFFRKEKKAKRVAFATSCWEKDWQTILLDDSYLSQKMIGNHDYAFHEKILIINNVNDESKVFYHAEKLKEKGIITHIFSSRLHAKEILSFFQLKREDFRIGQDANFYENVTPDWVYYNALAPLSAIYFCTCDYLLYMTGDVTVERKTSWIDGAIDVMEKKGRVKVANLTWNERYDEAKKESYTQTGDFFIAKSGFSDQMFLVPTKDFQQPIYGEIRADSSHFPRGDVFEKRVYSFMKNHRWKRITFKGGSYTHKSF